MCVPYSLSIFVCFFCFFCFFSVILSFQFLPNFFTLRILSGNFWANNFVWFLFCCVHILIILRKKTSYKKWMAKPHYSKIELNGKPNFRCFLPSVSLSIYCTWFQCLSSVTIDNFIWWYIRCNMECTEIFVIHCVFVKKNSLLIDDFVFFFPL